ncbi:MAG: sulfite exporter TauE/SafE family protein [Pseudolabrys sp.]|nr:sulfite exporter TauE/SafE family protein [Pseudolabrys sp.]MBV9259907.1 sulfite exporter TauE/SafE family protein [Pseudolabrys sp.]
MTLLADPKFLLLAAIATTFLGISKGGFIGLGVIAVPLLSLAIPPQQAAAVLLPILLTQDAVSVWIYHRDFSAWNLKVLVSGAMIGTVIATLVAGSLSPDVVRFAVGCIALLFIVTRLTARWIEHHLPKPSAISGVFWGMVAGFTSTIANAGSPPYQMQMLPQRLPKMTFVGTTALYFAATNAMKIPSYLAIGQLTWLNISAGLALIPLAIATNYLGVFLVRRVSMEAFYRIAYVLIAAIALELLRSSTMALLHH